jgi:hypothetical protein
MNIPALNRRRTTRTIENESEVDGVGRFRDEFVHGILHAEGFVQLARHGGQGAVSGLVGRPASDVDANVAGTRARAVRPAPRTEVLHLVYLDFARSPVEGEGKKNLV